MDKKQVQKITNKFNKNENDNFHSENAVLLAKNFGTDEDLANAERILREHHRIGHMTQELLTERDAIYLKLYPKLVSLREVYGISKR